MVNGLGWKCTLRNFRKLIAKFSPVGPSAEPCTLCYKLSALCSQLLLAKAAMHVVAFPRNTTVLNEERGYIRTVLKNPTEVCRHSVHFHPSLISRPSFLIFRVLESLSKTTNGGIFTSVLLMMQFRR